MKISKIFFGFLMVLAMSVYAFGLKVPAQKLVDAKWLNEHLSDKDLVVVDIREMPKMYTKSHIPNAIYWGVRDFRESRFKLPGFIVSPQNFKKLASRSGITDKSAVIFYSDGKEETSYTIATLGLYVASVYGIKNTAILNGGFASWEKAGFKTSTKRNKPKKTNFQIKNMDSSIVATIVDMDRAVETKNAVLVDGRYKKQFTGEKKHKKVKKAGHVPDAKNVFIGNFVKKDGNIFYINASKNDVKKLLTNAKINLKKPQIWYCNTGWFASGGWFASKYILGLKDTKVYEASMVEYSNMPERKMIK